MQMIEPNLCFAPEPDAPTLAELLLRLLRQSGGDAV